MSAADAPRHEPIYPPPSGRDMTRTPSPTPSEQRILQPKKMPRPPDMFKRENWGRVAVFAIVIAITVVVSVYQNTVTRKLEPASRWMHKTPGAWAIPIAILIVQSIPPLFGQEFVMMICGLTWGPGIGMAIASAGVLLGELGTFYLFKYLLRTRGARYEEKNVEYAILARVIHDGGVKIAIISRYSVIPSHLLTALFSTCGISLTTFIISAITSLPKPFVNVFLGYALKLQVEGHSTTVSNAINYTDIGVLTVVTALVARYMAKLQADIAPIVVYERRKRRQAGSVNPSPGTLEEGDAGPLNVLPLHEHSMAPASMRVPSPSLKGNVSSASLESLPRNG